MTADRAYRDLLAYGHHLGSCMKRVVIPAHKHRPAIHPHDCSCGLDAAILAARSPDDPDGPPIEFTTEPAPGVRDYNGALLAAADTSPMSPASGEPRMAPHKALAEAMEAEKERRWLVPQDVDWINYGSRVEMALWSRGFKVAEAAAGPTAGLDMALLHEAIRQYVEDDIAGAIGQKYADLLAARPTVAGPTAGMGTEWLAQALAIDSGWIASDWTNSSDMAREGWRQKANRILAARSAAAPKENDDE